MVLRLKIRVLGLELSLIPIQSLISETTENYSNAEYLDPDCPTLRKEKQQGILATSTASEVWRSAWRWATTISILKQNNRTFHLTYRHT